MPEVAPGRFLDPDTVVTHFHIKPGETVADFGAGVGYFVPALAAAIGSEGKLFACEIQQELVQKLGDIERGRDWATVTPVWCDLEAPHGSKLPDSSVDVGILINTLFMFEDKAAAIQEILRVVRPGGKIFVVDWTESFAGLGPAPEMVVDEAAAVALFESAGITPTGTYPTGDHHYGVVFRR